MDTKTALVLGVLAAVSSGSALAEVKEKPALYTYISEWALPRAKWGELDKTVAAADKDNAQDLASGKLVGYGDDASVLHDPESSDHDEWMSAMSLGALLDNIEQKTRSNSTSNSVFLGATKHADDITVSHYYNWRSGTFKGAYTREMSYQLKPDAPENAVEVIAQSIVPVLEKLLADKVLVEYEIDEQALHRAAPGEVTIVYITTDAAGLDKASTAIMAAVKENPVMSTALGSLTVTGAHRDRLAVTNAHYK